KRPATCAAGLNRILCVMALEDAFEHAALLAHDDGRVALGDRLAHRRIFLQALLLGLGVDHVAIGLGITPEDQRVGERLGIGLVGRRLAVHQRADIGIDATSPGALQQGRFAGGLRALRLALADRRDLVGLHAGARIAEDGGGGLVARGAFLWARGA